MSVIKSKKEIKLIGEGGKILSSILSTVIKNVKPGANIKDLDVLAEELIAEHGGKPSFKNYKGHKDDPPFPSTMCISINNEVVHGDGTRNIVLAKGDIVDFDLGMRYPAKGGLYTDMSRTVAVGKIREDVEKLVQVTKKSLDLGIRQIKPGNKIKDISRAIQEYVEGQGFSVVRRLVGHGVGHEVHEEPMIPNFVDKKWGNIVLKEGMVLAIEPMVNVGSSDIKTAKDGWTVITSDDNLSAHFEHTVAVTRDGYKILTK
jgi:methionyl aminopeptidase